MAKINNTVTATTGKNGSAKSSVMVTDKGLALFVSCPAASPYDDSKQEASILLDEAGKAKLQAQLQDFLDTPEAKATGIKDTGYAEKAFKADTDQDGNPTGLYRVKAKTAMIYAAKLYTAAGKVYTPTPGFQLPNRSTIRMSVKAELMSTSMFTGIVLRLQAIKIIDVPTYDDGMSGVEDEGGFDGGEMSAPEGAFGQDDTPASVEGNGWA